MRVRRRAFSPFSTAVLVSAFSINPTPSKEQREAIANAIGTTERRVQVWFQNRRQRISSKVMPSNDGITESSQETGPDVGTTECQDSVSTLPGQSPPCSPALKAATVPSQLIAELNEGKVKEGMNMEVYMTLYPPFEMLWASDDWLDFCGWREPGIVGKVSSGPPDHALPSPIHSLTPSPSSDGLHAYLPPPRRRAQSLKVIQGPNTDGDAILALMDAVARLDSVRLTLTNYTRSGKAC